MLISLTFVDAFQKNNKSPLILDLKDLKELDDAIMENKDDITQTFKELALKSDPKKEGENVFQRDLVRVKDLSLLFAKLEEITMLSLQPVKEYIF